MAEAEAEAVVGSFLEERRLEGAEKRKGKKEREEFGLVEVVHQDGYQEIKQYRFKSKSTLLHSLCHGGFFSTALEDRLALNNPWRA